MNSIIIKPKSEILKQYVQYFLFFKKEGNEDLSYTTFPNNNLCLAIYRQNKISYANDSKANNCIITEGGKNFTSRFYGFHKMPFQVNISSTLDQICIIFHPSALRTFTRKPYAELLSSDTAFEDVFEIDPFFIEQVFEQNDLMKRAAQLEWMLLQNLKSETPGQLKEALHIISRCDQRESLQVEGLSKELGVSNATLFRLFTNHLGQNPKSYLKTVRFRNVLDGILNIQDAFSQNTYLDPYYDQAHFIHELKTFSGYSLKQLLNKISVQQNDLTWIYNKK